MSEALGSAMGDVSSRNSASLPKESLVFRRALGKRDFGRGALSRIIDWSSYLSKHKSED